MAEEINANVTAGEAGQTANEKSIEQRVEDAFNAILAKNVKNENSILNSNFNGLTDEEKQTAYDLYNQKVKSEKEAKAKEIDSIKNDIKKKDETIAELQAKVKSYETEKRTEAFNNSIKTILNEAGIIEEGAMKQAVKLATAGVDFDTWFDENGAVKTEKFKDTIDNILKDIPSLKTAEEKKVEIKTTKPDDTAEAIQKRQDSIRKRWGLIK